MGAPLPVAMLASVRRCTQVLLAGVTAMSTEALAAEAMAAEAVAQSAQPATRIGIRGVVRDDSTRAPLPRVTVSVDGIPQVVLTDSTGRFAFTRVPRGTAVLRARRVGYAPVDLPVRVRDGETSEVTLSLRAAATTLAAVRTQAQLTERERFEGAPATSAVSLDAAVLRALPAIGEADVMRAVQLLPGVVARNDFTAGLNVRGGEQDQNLILLDGIPLYQPFHLGGVFSTFMDATVGSIRLHAGAPPVEFGGRLSSVLEVTSAEDVRRGVHGEAQMSVLAASLSLSGATENGQTAWQFAGRRTYADRIARSVADRDFPYAFYDGHLHVARQLPRGGRLALTVYHGRDALREDFTQREDTLGLDGTYALDWGNDAAGLTWSQPLGARSAAVQRISVTRFSSAQDEGGGALRSSNDVREWRASGLLRTDRQQHAIAAGYEVSQHDVLFKESSPQLAADLQRLTQRPVSGALFVDDTWRAASRLTLRPGLRVEMLSGASWVGWSPRLAARWAQTENTAFTATLGSTAQWVHALREEDDALRFFDRWVLSDSNIPVARALQGSVSAEHWLTKSRFVRVEPFVKRYSTLIERNLTDDRGVTGDEFRPITGTSSGFDLFLRQVETGPRSGWIAYTFTHNRRRDGVSSWLPAQDRRHTLNAVGTWRLGNGTVFSGRLGFGSGVPYTGVDAQIVRRIADPLNSRWDRGSTGRDVQPIAAARNAERLPAFARMDLSVQRTFVRVRTTLTPVFGIINATNRRNVFAYRFDYTDVPATRSSISQLPIVPTLGLTVAW